MKRLGLVAVGLLLAAGCSAPESGTVIGKNYSPASTWIDYQCMTYNTNGMCTLRMPVTHTNPESWCLVLRHGEDEGCRAVDQITYHNYRIGQEYP